MATTTTRGKFVGKRLQVAIDPKAKADEIAAILKRIYGVSGCTDCGRGGYDILLTHSLPELDPLKAGSIDKLQGVIAEDIAVGR